MKLRSSYYPTKVENFPLPLQVLTMCLKSWLKGCHLKQMLATFINITLLKENCLSFNSPLSPILLTTQPRTTKMDEQRGMELVQDACGRRVQHQLSLQGQELHLLCHLRYCDWVSRDILVKPDTLGTVRLE